MMWSSPLLSFQALSTYCGAGQVVSSPPLAAGPLLSPYREWWDCGSSKGLRLLENVTETALEENSALLSSSSLMSVSWQESLSEEAELNTTTFTTGSGVTIEVWLIPSLTAETFPQTFLSLVSSSSNGNSTDRPSWEGCGNGESIRLSEYQDHTLLEFQDQDPVRSCRQLWLQEVELQQHSDEWTHLAVVFGPSQGNSTAHSEAGEEGVRGTVSVYLQGEPVVLEAPIDVVDPITAFLGGNNRENETTSLELFSSRQSDRHIFEGGLQQVALWDSRLNATEVASRFAEGPSLPSVAAETQAPTPAPSATNMVPPEPMVNASLYQGSIEPLLLEWSIANTTTLVEDGDYYLQLVSLPTRGFLTLVPTADDEAVVPMTEDDMIPVDDSGTVRLHYRLFANISLYFSTPRLNAHGAVLPLEQAEGFDVRWTRSDQAMSTPNRQRIHVVHVNHKPTLAAPSNVTEWTTTTTREEEQVVVARIRGIELLDDLDANLNRVRVDVFTEDGGRLVLGDAGPADWESCLGRSDSAWQCIGPHQALQDAVVGLRSWTFVAVPSDVATILHNLTYHPPTASSGVSGDTVVVRVSDGAGGDCLSVNEHKSHREQLRSDMGLLMDNEDMFFSESIHPTCWQVEARIAVPSDRPLLNVSSSGKDRDFGLPDLLFWSLLVTVLCCCWSCIRQCCPRCLARGAVVDADDDDVEAPPAFSSEGKHGMDVCPHCGHSLDVSEDGVGLEIDCNLAEGE